MITPYLSHIDKFLKNKKNTCPLIVIVGPTASGKTRLGIEMAERYDGEIISADARQIYKYLDIGTAKPTPEETNKAQHHLIDFLEPDKRFTAYDFKKAAEKCIEDIVKRKKIPIVVGGTGFFIDTLIYNFDLPPEDKNIRIKLEQEMSQEGTEKMYQRLLRIDPQSAKNIHIHQSRHIVRALEIYEVSGKRKSDFSLLRPTFFQSLCLGISFPRAQLYERINKRVQIMWRQGITREVEYVLKKGFTSDCPGLSSLGYQEVCAYLRGEINKEMAQEIMAQKTRHYAKRQITWNKRNEAICFHDFL